MFRTKIRDRIELGVLGARFLLIRSEIECCQYPAYCSEDNMLLCISAELSFFDLFYKVTAKHVKPTVCQEYKDPFQAISSPQVQLPDSAQHHNTFKVIIKVI